MSADRLSHVLADVSEGEREDDRDTRRDVADLLSRLPDDDFEATRELVVDALGDEPEAIVAAELERRLTAAEDSDDDLSGEARRTIGRLFGRVDDDGLADLGGRVADVLECEPGELERHRERQQYRVSEGTDIVVEDGHTWNIGGVPLRRYKVLNWEIEPLSRLDMPGENLLAEVEIRTQDGKSFVEVIDGGVFDDRRKFGETFLGLTLGMEFDPSGPYSAQELMTKLNKYLATRDVPERVGTRHMGLHGSEWVVPGGSLMPDGWADEPETVYNEQSIPFEHQVALPTDRGDYDRDDVADILRHLPKTRPAERLLPVIGWFYAAPFRPHIFDMEGEFNLLNITGDTGSGKTTTLRYLWRCFGMKGEPFSADDTPFAHTRTMSATNAIPAWYDEYKPGDIEGWRLRRYHTLLRKAATGGIEQRGNRDKSVDEYSLRAPVVISGEQQIQPPAERRRSIMVTFKTGTTDEGTEWRHAYKQLAGEAMIEDGELVIPEDCPDPADHALAFIRWVAAQDRETIRERWTEARREVAARRSAWDDSLELDDLEVQGLQTILFGWSNYRAFAESVGVRESDLPGDADVEAALRHVVGSVGEQGKRKSHLEQYIELVSRAARGGALEAGEQFAIVNSGRQDEELRLHPTSTFDAISKYVRDHDLDGEDLLSAWRDYRKRFKERWEDEGDRLAVNYRQYTASLGTDCIGISMREAERCLDFDPAAFGSSSSRASDGDDETAAVALDSLPQRGYVTVEAEVADFETPAPGGGPGASGALRDETAVVDMTCWRDLADLNTRPERGQTYRFEDVKADTYKGAPQVEIVPGVTTVEPIQAGVGYSPGDDAGDNARLPTAANGGDAIEDATGRVNEYLRVHAEPGEVVTVSAVAGALHLSPDQAQHALDNLAQRKRIIPEDDRESYEVV